MINFKNVDLRRGTRVLFEHGTFTVHQGERLGITGANGTGKSSLFELLLGKLHAEGGDITMPPNLVVAHVAQETPATQCTALDYALDGDAELREIQAALEQAELADDGMLLADLHLRLDAAGGYEAPARAARLLSGLGFAAGDENRPVDSFSGGWRMRLNVAQALMCRSDLLLLDEPTNHLDLDAVIWLQEWLASYPGTLMLISHDRDFLDDLTDHILHIENKTLTLYTGNYSAFETRRAEMLSQQNAAFARQQRELTRIQGFVDRFRAQATKARQVQSRIKALERMTIIAQAQADSPFEFSFMPPAKSPSPLLKLDDAAAGYGGKPIFSKARITINPGDRIGLLGPNGAGKSTLVKLMTGELQVLDGERIPAQDLKIGYFAQHQLDQLRPDETALWHLQRQDPKATERDLRGYIGGFGFHGEKALEPIGPFSGGEKSRLALALLIYTRPNLLLLDEPTNHLDLNTRDALSIALQEYTGALVVVSHDRYLLRSVVDQYWLVSDGKVFEFQGDIDDYPAWLAERRAQQNNRDKKPGKSVNSKKGQNRGDTDRKKSLRPLEVSQQKAEEALNKLLKQKQLLETHLADPKLYEAESKSHLDKLLSEKSAIEKSLLVAESKWLEASEALETAALEMEQD